MSELELVKERVNRGFNRLNEQQPDWQHKINLDTLDAGKADQCVLNAVYGDYEKAKMRLFEDYNDPIREAYEHGFTWMNGEDNISYMQMVTDEWKRRIEEYLAVAV